MLQAAVFPEFKGADTLLPWGDTGGIAKLRHATAALRRGEVPTIEVNDLSVSTSDSPTDRTHKGSSGSR